MKIYRLYKTVLSGIDRDGYDIKTEETAGYYLHRETAELAKKVMDKYNNYKIEEITVDTSKIIVVEE